MRTLGTIRGINCIEVVVIKPAVRYAMAVNVDSASRTNPRAARNSRLPKPWLFRRTASGGPEIG